MIASPLDARSPRAVRDLLVSHGWADALAADAAQGFAGTAVHLEGLDAPALEALVHAGGRLGLDVLTGQDWAVVAGGASRLGALARPWSVPEPLAPAAEAIGHALPAAPPGHWMVRDRVISLERPVIMGILNVTPDSFSDGRPGESVADAVRRAEGLVREGAAIIDVGGESTRPGRTGLIGAEEELHRTVPVVAALTRTLPEVTISVDTMKASVARAALEAGAHVVNDVTALRHDPELAGVVAGAGAGLILMHSRGNALEIASDRHARYRDVTGEVRSELLAARQLATDAGVRSERIALDPGFGFSKTAAQNLELAEGLRLLAGLGQPLLAGPSRKRFLGTVTGRPAAERDVATAVCCALCFERGARIFRVHDAATTRDALQVAAAMIEPEPAA